MALVEAVRDLVSFFGGFRQGLQQEKEEEVLASPAFPDCPRSNCLMGKGNGVGWGGLIANCSHSPQYKPAPFPSFFHLSALS